MLHVKVTFFIEIFICKIAFKRLRKRCISIFLWSNTGPFHKNIAALHILDTFPRVSTVFLSKGLVGVIKTNGASQSRLKPLDFLQGHYTMFMSMNVGSIKKNNYTKNYKKYTMYTLYARVPNLVDLADSLSLRREIRLLNFIPYLNLF